MIKTIAIIIVMLVVNLLMILSISRAAKRVDYSLRKFFIQKLSMDDFGVQLPETLKDEIIEEETVAAECLKPLDMGPAVQLLKTDNVSSASYKSDSLKHDYRAIKQISYFTPENALTFAKRQVEKNSRNGNFKDYKGFLDVLDFDTVYSLSVLDPEKQEELIRASVDETHQSIIDDYKSETGIEFDAIDFHSYILQMADIYNSGFSIKVGDAADVGKTLSDGTSLVFDDQICEGAQVIYRNRLYDYSI